MNTPKDTPVPSPAAVPATLSIIWHMVKTDLRDHFWLLLPYWGLWLFKMIQPVWILAQLSNPEWEPTKKPHSLTTFDSDYLNGLIANWWWPTTGLLLLTVIIWATRFPSPLQGDGFWKKLPVTPGQRLGAKLSFIGITCCLIPLFMLGIALPLYGCGFGEWIGTISTTAFWLSLASLMMFTVVIIFRNPLPTFLIALCEILLAGLTILFFTAGDHDIPNSLEGSRRITCLALALIAMGVIWWLIYWKQAAWRANLICLILPVVLFLTHSYWPFDFLKKLPIPGRHGREFSDVASLQITVKDALFVWENTHDFRLRQAHITWAEEQHRWQYPPEEQLHYVQPGMTFSHKIFLTSCLGFHVNLKLKSRTRNCLIRSICPPASPALHR